MEQSTTSHILHLPQWRWIIVPFCLFVLFHLLPFFFLSSLLSALIKMTFWTRAVLVFSSLGLISIYVGYRARGMVFLESALAAVIYILTVKLFLPSYLGIPVYLQNTYFMLESIILGFVFAFGGAGIGYWLKRKYQGQ